MRKSFLHKCFFWCTNPISTVAGAALLLAIAGLLSRFLGLIRDRILASMFGAGDVLDIYYASFRIPDFLYGVLVLGALSAAFIPVFTKVYTKESPQNAWKLTSDFLILLIGAIGVIGFFAMLFMPVLIHGIAPGFDGEKREMAVLFSRIMLLSPILLGASAVFGGVLIARKSFLAYSLAPIFYNIGIIFGALVLVDLWGLPGLAWGVVIGALMHFCVQMPATFRSGYVFALPKEAPWKNKQVRKILFLMLPQVFSVASNQINFWIITIFASLIASGSLAVFNLANNLQSIPLALVGVSFAVAVFPKLSQSASDGDMKEFTQTFLKTLRRILYFVVPATVFLILLRAQIVRVVLGGGVFDWKDTVLTYQVLGILSLSLFAQSLLPLIVRAFYSLEDTKTPFFIALFSQAINILIVISTLHIWGVYSLAIGFSVASTVQVALLMFILKKQFTFFDVHDLYITLLRIIFATVVSALAIQTVKYFWGSLTEIDTFIKIFGQLMVSGFFGLLVYILMSHVLKIEEFCDFRNKVYVRIFGKPRTLAVSQQQDIEGM